MSYIDISIFSNSYHYMTNSQLQRYKTDLREITHLGSEKGSCKPKIKKALHSVLRTWSSFVRLCAWPGGYIVCKWSGGMYTHTICRPSQCLEGQSRWRVTGCAVVATSSPQVLMEYNVVLSITGLPWLCVFTEMSTSCRTLRVNTEPFLYVF